MGLITPCENARIPLTCAAWQSFYKGFEGAVMSDKDLIAKINEANEKFWSGRKSILENDLPEETARANSYLTWMNDFCTEEVKRLEKSANDILMDNNIELTREELIKCAFEAKHVDIKVCGGFIFDCINDANIYLITDGDCVSLEHIQAKYRFLAMANTWFGMMLSLEDKDVLLLIQQEMREKARKQGKENIIKRFGDNSKIKDQCTEAWQKAKAQGTTKKDFADQFIKNNSLIVKSRTITERWLKGL